MSKMYRKEFQYRGQQINYYNKLRMNENIQFVSMSITGEGKKVIEYRFK